jgi:branched-chain amino acid transport system substrate-binding protein
MRKLVLIVLVVFLSISAFSTIKVGAILPMTGGVAAFGQMIWQGVKLANELFPQVLGQDIEIVLLDNNSDKVQAVNTTRRAIEQDKGVAIIGQVISSNTIAGGAVAEENGVAMVSPSSTNPLVTQDRKYVSRVCFSDPFQGVAAALLAFNNMGAKNVAVFVDVEQDYAVGFANFFKDTAIELGGTVFYEYYKSGDQDFTAQISDALSKNADAFFIPGYYQEIALIAIQARQLGFYDPIIAGDGAAVPETIEIGGAAVNGLYFTTHYDSGSPAITDNAKLFVEAYTQKYGEAPGTFTALGFDTYLVIRDAIERAGSTDREAIAKAVRQTKDFPAVTGIITINESGDAIKSVAIVKIENGKFVYDTTINP